jgi:HTH-type transcriptional regulator/antitoxin MqsA
MDEALIADGKRCPVCFKGRLSRGVKRVTLEYKGRAYEEEQPGDWCDTCGEGILNGADLEATEAAWLAFRERVDKEEGRDLARIRRKLKLTQAEAARLTCGAKQTFAEYERGVARPLPAVTNLFKLLDKHPEMLKDLKV